MFDWLVNNVSDSPITYLVVAVAVLFDALIPLVPSEATIVAATIVASHGDLSVLLVFATAAVSATVGDNAAYWLGRSLGRKATRKVIRGEKGRRRLAWAERTIHERPWIVTIGRFVPGGRTATTLAAGTVRLRWITFLIADAIGGTLWAFYATALGYLGGSAFRHSLWKPLLVSGAAGVLIAGSAELARRVRGGEWLSGRERERAAGTDAPDDDDGESGKRDRDAEADAEDPAQGGRIPT